MGGKGHDPKGAERITIIAGRQKILGVGGNNPKQKKSHVGNRPRNEFAGRSQSKRKKESKRAGRVGLLEN